ncbi:hypothetical protein [Glaciibacter superstes]|uniref:hypothetical protein n=1 Tax=Glaciibacter superstes TaxID=501023 RepID=UPI0003B2F63C|nr:hypothetical protein [Glaciibacter superstes]
MEKIDAEKTSTVSVEVAQHVLWHFGDRQLGQEPGSFTIRLLRAIAAADQGNKARLRQGFPELVEAFTAVQQESWGMDWLRSIVKKAWL